MSSVNKISSDYIFFRFPLNYLLVLIPIIVSVAGNVFFDFTSDIPNLSEFSPKDNVYNSVDTFLLSMKISISVLLAFSVCYRWSSMQYDGSYGYWLTQGLGRKEFYFLTVVKFFLALLISEMLGFGLVVYLNQLTFKTMDLLLLFLLMAAQLFLILSIAVFLGVIFKTSELASLSFLSLVGFNTAFNRNKGSYYSLIFQPDAHYLKDGWMSLIFASATAFAILLLGLRFHTKLDLRL